MIQLTANLSEGLISLIQEKALRIDAVEVGPWFSVEQILKYRQKLPGWKFYLHHSNLISRLKWIPGTGNLLRAYIECTQSPWLSLHYSLLPPGYAWLGAKFGIFPPPPNYKSAVKWFIEEVNKLKTHNLPLLLENMPTFPTSKYAFNTSTDRIREILSKTDVDFLLDIAHARVVASIFGVDVHNYIDDLPLERVRQIHISGVRERNGHLYDAHEDLGEEDYELLKWVLKKTKPEVVALEYFKDREKTREQLNRINEIVKAA